MQESFRLKIKADTRTTQRRLRDYQRAMKQDLREILIRHLRLLAVQLAFVTMPRGFAGTVKKKAERDLESDLRKIAKNFQQFREGFAHRLEHPWFQRLDQYLQDGNLLGIDMMLRESRLGKTLRLEKSMAKEFHRSQRVNGKVNNPKQQYLIAQAGTLKSYLAREKRMVGAAKGGWASGAADLGGTHGMPRWVSRHMGRSDGEGYVVSIHEGVLVGVLANFVDYADEIIRETSIREAKIDSMRKFEKHMRHVVRHYRKTL